MCESAIRITWPPTVLQVAFSEIRVLASVVITWHSRAARRRGSREYRGNFVGTEAEFAGFGIPREMKTHLLQCCYRCAYIHRQNTTSFEYYSHVNKKVEHQLRHIQNTFLSYSLNVEWRLYTSGDGMRIRNFFSPGLEGMGVGMNLCEDGWWGKWHLRGGVHFVFRAALRILAQNHHTAFRW